MVLPSTKSPPAQSIKLKKIDQEPKECFSKQKIKLAVITITF